MRRTALIIGITGQDGSYLAEQLLPKGYCVLGLTRSLHSPKCEALRSLLAPQLTGSGQFDLYEADYADNDAVQAWIDAFNERPLEERERVVPALASLPKPPRRSQPKRKPAAKAKKAARQARKRNRRR